MSEQYVIRVLCINDSNAPIGVPVIRYYYQTTSSVAHIINTALSELLTSNTSTFPCIFHTKEHANQVIGAVQKRLEQLSFVHNMNPLYVNGEIPCNPKREYFTKIVHWDYTKYLIECVKTQELCSNQYKAKYKFMKDNLKLLGPTEEEIDG